MNDLSSFFFNTIPGTIFILVFYHFNIFNNVFKREEPSIFIFELILGGLFFGYLFHSFVVFLLNKKLKYDSLATDFICETAFNKELIMEANKELNKIVKGSAKKRMRIENFYLMNNYIQSNYTPILISDFSKRRALWGNFYIMSLILLPIALVKFFLLSETSGEMTFTILLLIFFTYLCHKIYMYFQVAYYESTIKTFISVRIREEAIKR